MTESSREPADAIATEVYVDRIAELASVSNLINSTRPGPGARPALDDAVAAMRRQLIDLPEDDPDRPFRMLLLAVALQHRHATAHDPADLDAAVTVLLTATRCADEDPWRAEYHTNLSATLLLRYQATQRAQDLDDAVEHADHARVATSPDHPHHAKRLSALGSTLRQRGLGQRSRHDVSQAQALHREALAVADPDDPRRARFLAELGMDLIAQHLLQPDPDALRDASQTLAAAMRLAHPYDKAHVVTRESFRLARTILRHTRRSAALRRT